MAHADRGSLFGSIHYWLDSSIAGSLRRDLEVVLRNGGAEACARPEARQQSQEGPRCTHVITHTIDTPDYEDLKHSGINFVTTRWVSACCDNGQLYEARYYSPDPKDIFSGVIVCVAELLGNDANHIKAIVAAYGGQFRGPLTKEVTHLVAVKPEGKKYTHAIKAGKRYGMKVVLPHWVFDSLRASLRVPEEPFLFPNPPLFAPQIFDPHKGWRMKPTEDEMQIDSSSDDHVAPTMTNHFHGEESERMAEESWRRYLDASRLDTSSTYESKLLTKVLLKAPAAAEASRAQIFAGKTIYFSADLQCQSALLDALQRRTASAGGSNISPIGFNALEADEALRGADIVICEYRTGWEYWLAHEESKLIGNLNWLIYCFANGRYSGPQDHLLHYPVPKEAVPGFERVDASLTNYSGLQRDFLKRLIELMGGKFDGELRGPDSDKGPATVLIAGQAVGRKIDFARRHDIDIVNHTWLEKCFIEWKCLPYDYEPIFALFEAGIHYQDRVGRQGLPRVAIMQWGTRMGPANDHLDCMTAHHNELNVLVPAPPAPLLRQPRRSVHDRVDAIAIADSEDEQDHNMAVDEAGSPTQSRHNLPALQSTSLDVQQQLIPPSHASASRSASHAQSESDSGAEEDVDEDEPIAETPPRPQSVAPDAAASSVQRHDKSSRLTSEVDAENVVTTSAKRAAQVKAAAGVSANAKDMTRYQEEQRGAKKRRQSGIEILVDEANPVEESPQAKRSKATVGSRLLAEQDHAEASNGRSRTRAVAPLPARKVVRLLCTGSGNELPDAVEAGLKALGVKLEDDPKKCTHVCGTVPKRTRKFMLAMINRAHFVSHQWAKESIRAGRLLDEVSFPLSSETAEAEGRAKANEPVLKGHTFHLTSDAVSDDAKLLREIIKAAGGELLEKPKLPWPKDADALDTLHIISCQSDIAKCKTWLKQSPLLDVRVADYVIHSIMHQQLGYSGEATLLFTRR